MLGLDNDPIQAPPAAGTTAQTAPPLPTGQLDAESVPQAVRKPPEPLMRIIMPVVMVAAIGAMVAIFALSGRGISPMMMVFPLMMIMGLLTTLNPPEKAGDIDESRRVYLRHLDALAERARSNAAQQREHVEFFHPHPDHLVNAVDAERVWERTSKDPRAYEVRVGTGRSSLCTPVEVADPGSPEDLDPVCAVSLRRTVAAVSTVPRMPIVIQLEAFPLLTLAGPRAHEVARSIVAQLAFFHGTEAIGLEISAPGLEAAKWLPHTRDPGAASFTVAVVDAASPKAMAYGEADCVLAVTEDTDAFVHDDALHLLCGDEIDAVTTSGVERLGETDTFSAGAAEFIYRNLAFYRRPDNGNGNTPRGGGLLDLLGIDDIDHLAGPAMWPGREGSRQRLTVPIGVDPNGGPVYLDLKESAHGGMGPHGLCIGATGSGKSELLKTLVVALAATHSPDELNLVLVDFKGGATFLGCEGLPHTSAVITNLEDEAVLVERMFDAISGEMNRRQELLRAAGNFANITEYNAARTSTRPDLDPLPSLVIVVDEFSELLGQHPNFADLFVAVGRLGRSLGVHLLLASQRLEEGKLRGLDSHLSYRIGLRTFSAAESRQVLGVSDAYELPADPGAGYIKTASTELTRFKASYVSGPLMRPAEPTSLGAAPQVRLFAGWDEVDEPAVAAALPDPTTTLLAEVVSAAQKTAAARGQSAHTVWLPPLPPRVGLPEVCEASGELKASIGLIDDPYHQRQDPLTIDLGVSGGHVALAGGPQTGKSMAVRTIIASLAATHTTDQLGFYVIDAGGGDSGVLESLPHVAGVAGRGDEEKVKRVVDEVLGIVDKRRAFPARTVLVVDGWHSLVAADSKLEDLKDALATIAAEGPAAGVHLVVTTQRWNAVRPNVRDLIGTRLELKLTEPMDSLLDRKLQEKLPAAPGRGITAAGKSMLIAATAKEDIAHIAAQAADQTPVPKLKVLPARIAVDELAQSVPAKRRGRILLGIGGRDVEPVTFDRQHLLAVGASGAGKSTLVATVIGQLATMPRERARMVVIDPRRTHLRHADHPMVAAYGGSTDAAKAALADTATTLTGRLPGPDITAEQLAARNWWTGPDIYVVVDDLELVGEENLRPLLPLIPHAHDIGLHIIAARKFGGTGRALLAPFLSALKDQLSDVVLFSGTKDEGALFGVRPLPLRPGRGIFVRDNEQIGPIHIAENTLSDVPSAPQSEETP
ncbi:type VII secretion protein EccCa [uncultured Corynebacterium sp.]|uniref:type VII secretion protein EccCa n=1 Tax=uncultured Corynebacterium sp. TaxID=159447 RepID=UPI0025ECFB00|nr:type VII secretion protein EccCa [uncultured Corynebacterium sp.]